MFIGRRYISEKFPLSTSNIDIKRLIKNVKVQVDDITNFKSVSKITKNRPQINKNQAKSKHPTIELYQKYNKELAIVQRNEFSKVNAFFNLAAVKFEWSAATFTDIPGEKDRKINESNKQFEVQNPSLKHSSNTQGAPLQLLNGLPEIAFLGRCNAGKSTLLNTLTTKFQNAKLNNHARVSKKAGFTKTINCFNIGNRLRLIDTPGYGVKGKTEQGTLTMAYLRERRELRRCFLLISAEQGFNKYDFQLLDYLTKYGIPFEIVFTKIDKIKDINIIERHIQDSGALNLPILPQFLFLNSVTNTLNPKRHGISHIRHLIFQVCNMKPGILPSKSFRV